MDGVHFKAGTVPGACCRRQPSAAHRTSQKIFLTEGLRPAVIVLALITLGSGCASTNNWWNSDSTKKSATGAPTGSLSQIGQNNLGPVIQASGTIPVEDSSKSNYSAWLAKPDKISKRPATQVVATWRNWIDYLPDPTKEGHMGPGLAGQLFLFDSALQPVQANGTVIVDLYDVTQRAPGQQGNVPERWEITKDSLKTLLSVDERLGPFFVLFLPWPTYRPDVTQVRITTRYVSEGRTLYAQDSNFTVTPKPQNLMTTSWTTESQTNPAAFQQKFGSFSPDGGLPSSMGMGSITPHSLYGPSGMTMPSGTTSAPMNGPPASTPSPALPISGAAMNMAPMSAMTGAQSSQQIPVGAGGAPVSSPSYGFPAGQLNR